MIYAYNFLTPYWSDDYAYLMDVSKADSLGALVKQQYGEYLSNSGKYVNQVLRSIQEHHRNNERILAAFFATEMSTEKRWELIEQYFLGNEDYVRQVLNINL